MILELKDKTLDLGLAVSSPSSSPHHLHEQVIDGLQGLGYSSKDAENAWESITELAATPEVTVSILMRAALQSLARS
jgi:Holliday junction DNA helicase RuvA